MALRLNSLQAKAAIASAILAGFTLNALALIMQQRSAAREQIERNALNFAELTNAPISTERPSPRSPARWARSASSSC